MYSKMWEPINLKRKCLKVIKIDTIKKWLYM